MVLDIRAETVSAPVPTKEAECSDTETTLSDLRTCPALPMARAGEPRPRQP